MPIPAGQTQFDQSSYSKAINPQTGLTDIFQNVGGNQNYIDANAGKTLFSQGLNADLLPTISHPEAKAPVVSSSDQYRTDINNLGTSITDNLAKYGIKPPDSSLDTYFNDYKKTITDQQDVLKTRNAEDVARLGTSYDTQAEQLKLDQADQLAKAEGRTRIGGFFTQLEAKDILNLQTQHRLEIATLESKKQDAIQQAQRAYQDGNYTLAKDLVTEAKSHEQDIYNRKKDFYDYIQSATSAANTATNLVRDDANKKIEDILAGVKDGTIDANKLDPTERKKLLDQAGYTFDVFKSISDKVSQGKVVGSPYTDTKTGKVYVYVQKSDGSWEQQLIGKVTPTSTGTEAQNKAALAKQAASKLASIQTAFHTPGGNGDGLAGSDGKIDPANYRAAMQLMADKYGIEPSVFMTKLPPERFLSPDELKRNPDLSSAKSGSAGASNGDVETYAQGLSDGSVAINNVPTAIRAQVLARSQEIDAEASAGQ